LRTGGNPDSNLDRITTGNSDRNSYGDSYSGGNTELRNDSELHGTSGSDNR